MYNLYGCKSKKLFKDNLNVKNSKLSSEIEVGYKGITLYSKRGNNV
jgi:hypothetical protein